MTKPLKFQNRKRIQDIIGENERFHAALELVHASYAATNNASAADVILSNELGAIGLEVKPLEGGGNNKNYIVTNPLYPDEKIVIQICRKNAEAEAAFNTVTSSGVSSWQAKTYDSVKGHATDGLNNSDMIHVTAMEYCPGSLKKTIENADDAERITVAVNIGSQLSQMLTAFAIKGVVWTDMKPGNVLLRQDMQIVIADTKGFMDPADKNIVIRKNGTIQMGDLTKAYLSENFQMYWQMNTKPETVLNVWNKEYSYQLAVMLHYMATGTERHSYEYPWQEEQQKKLMNSDEPVFNFDHPIFKSDQGQRLQTVIERLSAKKLEQRFRHADAIECLKVLNKPAEFAVAMDNASNNVRKGGGLVVSVSTEKATKYMKAMKDIQSAQAKFISAKIDERKALEQSKKEQGVRGKVKTAYETLRDKVKSKSSKTDTKQDVKNEEQESTRHRIK